MGVGVDFDFWAGFSHQGNYWHDRSCRWVTHNFLGPSSSNVCDCPSDVFGRAGPENRRGCRDILNPIHLTTQAIPEKVAQFLDTRNPHRPFALSVSFKAPHAPWQDSDHNLSTLYEGVEMPVSPTVGTAETSGTADFLARSLASEACARPAPGS